MKIIKIISFLIFFFFIKNITYADSFESWVNEFRKTALKEGISEKTLDETLSKIKFLPKVIEYDRYQPEFYEDTKTYISKRTSQKKISTGKKIFSGNNNLILDVEKQFEVEKELLLSLMGIETNFGTYLGKMDILSSLATLSYDKRRSKFFTSELIIILKLIDANIINRNILFGSWAGAFGNFQFMPSTINNYAIDYNHDGKIDLKSSEDSFASAANYLSKIGWKSGEPCFIRVNLKENIPTKYLNTSAKKIKNKKKLKNIKKFIETSNNLNTYDDYTVGIVTPDSEIVENSNKLNPAYLVFNNYEVILKWNRSLRFALAVCTLKDHFNGKL